MITGYLPEQPFVSELWAEAGHPYEATDNPDNRYKHLRGVAGLVTSKPREIDPGAHEVDLGENFTVVTEPEPVPGGTESILHLVQDEETIA
eukprot:4971082-Karenia_brevis.AAC.1